MKKGVIIGLIAGIVLVLVIVGFFILSNNGEKNYNQENSNPNDMVDCGMMDDPGCFLNRMNECLPVTGKFMAGENTVEMIVLGVENETCHFQRKINNIMNMNCYFPNRTMDSDILAQTFGEDKGLQSVVDEACKATG